MEISNEKISELLKNPEIVGMIASLASGFSAGSSGNSADTTDTSAQEKAIAVKNDAVETISQENDEIPDVSFPKSKVYSDKRIALLQAIKPYINDEKKNKVDSLVKAIGVAGILNTYTGGVFGSFFGKQ